MVRIQGILLARPRGIERAQLVDLSQGMRRPEGIDIRGMLRSGIRAQDMRFREPVQGIVTSGMRIRGMETSGMRIRGMDKPGMRIQDVSSRGRDQLW
jgi:hypothetical protein